MPQALRQPTRKKKSAYPGPARRGKRRAPAQASAGGRFPRYRHQLGVEPVCSRATRGSRAPSSTAYARPARCCRTRSRSPRGACRDVPAPRSSGIANGQSPRTSAQCPFRFFSHSSQNGTPSRAAACSAAACAAASSLRSAATVAAADRGAALASGSTNSTILPSIVLRWSPRVYLSMRRSSVRECLEFSKPGDASGPGSVGGPALHKPPSVRARAPFRVRSRAMEDRRTGRRFRTRLLPVLLVAGLLPLAGGGLVAGFGLSRMLSLSLGRLDPLLERAQAAADPGLSRELAQARVDLLQAELARRSIARLAPWALLAAVGISAAL